MYKTSFRNHLVHSLLLSFTFINLYQATIPVIEYNGWEEIKEGWPQEDEYNKQEYNESTAFYYVTNLISTKTWVFNNTLPLVDDQIYKLSFKYWSWKSSKGSVIRTDVHIDGYPTDELYHRYYDNPISFSGNWMPVEYVLTGQQLKNMYMNIFTGTIDSIGAFKDIKLEYESTTQISNELDKSRQNYSIPNGTFTIKDFNSRIKTTINNREYFKIEYLNSEDIELNVVLKLDDNPNEGQTIFTLKPKVTQTTEIINLFLDDLIAISAKKLYISFNIKHFEKKNNFLFVVNKEESNSSKSMIAQNFLLPMKKDNMKEWQNEWIVSSTQTGSAFTIKDDHVQFHSVTKSQTRASTYLISNVWIKYNSTLHDIDSQYSVKVEDNSLFDSFIIRAKVCDWLSHCQDVIQTNEIDKKNPDNTVQRTISFKFNPIENSEYIKLHFYIEYFAPSYKTSGDSHTVKFELKLDHFGDPCFSQDKCMKGNTALCESDPSIDIPNKLTCNCDNQWTGDLCDEPDHCRTVNEKLGKSGGKHCDLLNGSECQNLNEGFRCLCGVVKNEPESSLESIFWRNDSSHAPECYKLEENKMSHGWKLDAQGTPKSVQSPQNVLIYNFGGIDTKIFDICLNVKYQSEESVTLSVDYLLEVDHVVSSLLDINLKISALGDQINFCMSDFAHSVREDFNLEFKIRKNDNNFVEDKTFVLQELKPVLKRFEQNRETKYITSWVNVPNVTDSLQNKKQNWRSIPNEIFLKEEQKEMLYMLTIPTEVKESVDYLFISDWITYDNKFEEKSYDFTIRFTRGTKENFKIFLYSIHQKPDQIEPTVKKLLWNDMNSKLEDDELDINMQRYSGQFKVSNLENVFKIFYQVQKNDIPHTQPIVIEFRNFSMGDPCLSDSNLKNVCPDNKCKRQVVNTIICDCEGQNSIGDLCDQDDYCKLNTTKLTENKPFEEHCLSFANAMCDQFSPKCKCDEKNYVWDPSTERCVQKIFYYSHQKRCEGNTCELFDKIKTESKWWDKTMPKVIENSEYLPFRYTTQVNSDIKIKFTNYDKGLKYDPCLNITYQLSNPKSGLQVSYGENKPIELTTFLENSDEWITEQICVNTLVKDIGKDFNIVLKPRLEKPNTDSISVKFFDSFIKNETKDFSISNTFDFLRHWNQTDKQYEPENQWPLAYPNNDWVYEQDDQLTFQPHYPGAQNSVLVSNWIEYWKNITGYKLRFQMQASNESQDYSIRFEVFNEKLSSMSNRILYKKDIDTRKFTSYTIPINPLSPCFRVAIKVTYNNYNHLVPRPLFWMKLIDLADPCVNDKTEIETCSDRGTCQPVQPVVEYHCECRDGFIDETKCIKKDYCNSTITGEKGTRTGNEICHNTGSGSCFLGGVDGYYCDCDNDLSKYWVKSKERCETKDKCWMAEYDANLRECILDSNTNSTKFPCKKGFVEISSKCEKYEVCNEEHRKNKEHVPNEPCPNNSKSSCYPTFKFTDPERSDDYKCVCETGYKNIGDDKHPICEPLFCELPSMNECNQKCTKNITAPVGYTCGCFDSDYYELKDENVCSLKTKTCDCPAPSFCVQEECKCKGINGNFIEPSKDNDGNVTGCQPNEDEDVSKDVCPDGKVTVENNELVCDCGETYNKTDKNMCSLISICDEESDGRKDCDRRNKLCYLDSNEKGYTCAGLDRTKTDECLEGMFDLDHNCIDNCKARERKDCGQFNAFCDPTVPVPITKNENVENYCKCRPGFIDNSEFMCVVGKYTVQFSLGFKNSIFNSDSYELPEKLDETHFKADLNGYYNGIRTAHRINLNRIKKFTEKYIEYSRNQFILPYVKYLIKQTKNYYKLSENLRIQKCEENNGYYNCMFTLTLNENSSTYSESLNVELSQLCIPLDTKDGGLCFFPLTKGISGAMVNYATESDLPFITHLNELKIEPKHYKTCENSAKHLYTNCEQNSNCKDSSDPESSYFKCVCDREYYQVISQDRIPNDNKPTNNVNETIREHCIIKPGLCKEKCLEKAECTNFNISIFRENTVDFYVPLLCNCPNKTREDNRLRACVEVCHGINCNDGVCIAKGERQHEPACNCNEKYHGEFCDKKLSEGGWVAAVAVLAVVVVIVVGVAVYFARRKRNAGINSGSTRQLDDFSDNTSYRVRQSGGVV